MAPADAPVSRTRAQRFDDLVGEEVSRLQQRWKRELSRVEFIVDEVPPVRDTTSVPLSRVAGSGAPHPAQIVIYRRPVEARGDDESGLSHLIRTILVEDVADLLGLAPESVDPAYDPPG